MKIDERIKMFLDERYESHQKDEVARDVEFKVMNDDISKLQEQFSNAQVHCDQINQVRQLLENTNYKLSSIDGLQIDIENI